MTGLPKEWAAPTLEEVFEFNPKHDSGLDQDQLVSFVPMPAVSEHSGAIEAATDRPLSEIWKGYTHFADGDVIFAKITPCMENGKSAVARGLTNGIACGSTEFHVLRSKGAVLPDYVWRFMRQDSFRRDAEAHMTGAVGQRRVPKPYLERHPIPLPPLPEQRRIVRKLDTLSARSTTARTHLTAIEKLAGRYKLGFYLSAFAAPQDQVELGTLAKVGTGATPKKGVSRYYADGTVPWVTSGAVNAKSVTEPSSFITEVAIQETNCKVFPAGSLLMAMYGEGKTRGQVARLEIAAATNQALAVIHELDEDQIDSEYLFRFLDSIYLEIREQAEGGVQPNLNLGKVKSFKVPLPKLDEQREIVRRIETAFVRIDRLAAEATKALKLLSHLDQRILAKAFAGELVPQDPTDEPAETLLARIRAERAAAPKPKRGRKKVST